MRYIFLLSLLACTQDVSIITVDKKQEDTADITGDDVINPEPTSEPAQEPSDTMTDLTSGYGEIHFRQIACPACVGESSEFDISAILKLHQPTSGDYTDYLQAPGTCTTSLIDSYVSTQPLSSNQQASFNGMTLNPNGPGEWYNGFIYEYQYERNTSYSVTSEHGVISNAFTTIEGFDDIQPYTLLWVDPSYAYDAVISKSGTNFSWYPVVNNSLFEIIIAVYSSDGSQFLGAVSCLENDIGSMYIPGSYFQTYPYWSIAAVHLIRHKIDRVPAVELNGYFQSHMLWEVVGTGHIE